MRYVRVPVEVVIACKVDGTEAPITLIWPDGREFEIESCAPKKKMRCEKTYGDDTFRYGCVIKGKRSCSTNQTPACSSLKRPCSRTPKREMPLRSYGAEGQKWNASKEV